MINCFWELWEEICKNNPNIANDYCNDDEFSFHNFRNEIKCKSDKELCELMLEIYNKIENEFTK